MASQTQNYTLLSEIVERLHTLEKMVDDLEDAAVLDQFRRWVSSLFQERLAGLGFEPKPGEPAEISEQRASVIDALGTLAHDPEVIRQAGILAEREAIDPQSVDANLAGVELAIHAQFGDEAVFRKYVDLYQARKASGAPPQTVNRYLNSFPFFRSPELTAQVLSLLDEGIAPLEAWGPLLYKMLTFHHSRLTTWAYIKKNWSTIRELGFWTGELIMDGGELPYSMRNDYVEFSDSNAKGLVDMSYAQGLENMDLLEDFRARTKEDLPAWLNKAANK
jgi:hypothetical protein